MNASEAEFRAAKEATGPESISVLSLLRGHRFDPFERRTRIRRDHGPETAKRWEASSAAIACTKAARW
jgi:hypothetical protein